jgi:hypothetical protein
MHINLSSVGFRNMAHDLYKCYLDFKAPGRFSIVPFHMLAKTLPTKKMTYSLSHKSLILKVGPAGFEPTTYRL